LRRSSGVNHATLETLESRRLLSVVPLGRPPVLKGLAAMGDSITDEYSTHAPLRTPHRAWVEILADTRKLNFGGYSAAERPFPREAGYQFNWARDGATTEDLVDDQQAAGIGNAAAAGSVSLVFIHAGHNDFSQLARSSDPIGQYPKLVPEATKNLKAAIDRVLASSPNVRVVVATLFDVRYVPSVRLAIATGLLPREALPYVAAAQRQLNDNIRAFAADPRVAVADVAAVYDKFLTRPVLRIGGTDVAKFTPGSRATDFWTADAVHPGTLGQALIANAFIAAANAKFGAAVRPLTGDEMLAYARKVSTNPFSSARRIASMADPTDRAASAPVSLTELKHVWAFARIA
jgi:lysophospholipase L1-like esterase